MSSPTVSKKRKHAEGHSPSKRAKIEHPESSEAPKVKSAQKKEKRKSKGKQRLEEAEQPLDQDFAHVLANVTLSIPPMFANNPQRGVEELLDSLVMKYSSALEGVVVAHSDATFVSSTALLIADSPFSTARVVFKALVWRPRIGMRLRGAVSLCGPDHVGLIVHRTFNCSVPRWGLDEDIWEWVPGMEDDLMEDEGVGGWGEGGWWKAKATGEKLGGQDGKLDFTVVGMTIANQMLSLTGSLHSNPFNPAHLPTATTHLSGPSDVPRASSAVPESDEVDPTEPTVGSILAEHDLSPDSEEEEDPFADLGRMRAETAARQEREAREAELAAKAEKKAKKEEKRKRKAEAMKSVDQARAGEPLPKKTKRKKDKDKGRPAE